MNMVYPALVAGGWVALAYALCQQRSFLNPRAPTMPTTVRCGLSFGATALVLASMMVVLPQQRKMKIVDGPGMVMFTAGWALVVAALAYKGKK